MDVVTFVAAWITLLVATTFGAHRVSLGGVAVHVRLCGTNLGARRCKRVETLRIVWLIEISKEF